MLLFARADPWFRVVFWPSSFNTLIVTRVVFRAPAANPQPSREHSEDHAHMAQKYFKANHLKLESLRIARGMSRQKLASKAIVSPRTLDSIMAGKQAVISTFSKLAKALDAPVESI